jgi:hypothetical protein
MEGRKEESFATKHSIAKYVEPLKDELDGEEKIKGLNRAYYPIHYDKLKRL